MKARLIFREKNTVRERFIVEYRIHDVGKSRRYPDGLKYAIICFDTKTQKRVLMDNHHPKGHHLHIDDEELPYEFSNIDSLVEDFKKLVFNHLGVRL